MGGGENHLMIGGEAVQRLRKAFPRQTSLEQKAETIINEWLEDRDAIKAANASEKRSAGKPRIRSQDLFKECGL